MICKTPPPPYYAAIFTSILNEVDESYDIMSELTEETANTIDGYLGNEHFRDENGFGIHISYWRDMEAIENWRNNALHKKAKTKGMNEWYKHYSIRIAKVEHESKR